MAGDRISRRSENGIYEYRRRVPKAVAHLETRTIIKESLGTRDREAAAVKARGIDRALDELWAALLQGHRSEDVWERYRSAVAVARSAGFSYRPATSFTDADIDEIIRRVEAARAAPLPVAEAIVGTIDEPQPRLSDLWRLYQEHNAAGLEGMSPNQLRKHRVPRERAIGYATQAMGDKELARIDRSDVLTLRQWWITRLQAENLRADTVNRCFSDIAGMLTVVDAALHTSFRDVWAGVRLRETNKTRTGRRAPYPVDFVRDRVLAPGALDGLNPEARATVLLIIETGARPSELCNLRPEDFALDADVPHIAITERGDRRVKTSHSLRTIPLVGCALAGARLVAATGFVRYADKEDTLSNTINAYLEENGLRPSPLHTLYSFRHTFQDRLTAADVIDRMQTALMGHAFDRPTYGDGPTLEQKLKVLEQIRIS